MGGFPGTYGPGPVFPNQSYFNDPSHSQMGFPNKVVMTKKEVKNKNIIVNI